MATMILGQLVNGVVSGFLLVLIAMGLTLTLGLLRVINLAHPALFTVGAYVGFSAYGWTGNFYAAILAALATGLIVGSLLEVFFIRRSYHDPDLSMLLCFGILFGITEIVRIIWGVNPQSITVPETLSGVMFIGDVPISFYRLFAVSVSGAIAAGVWIFLKKTSIGLIVRAILDNRDMVEAFQVNTSNALLMVFALGSGVGAAAGCLGSPIFGIFPDVGMHLLPIVLAVVLLGGAGSFRGLLISGPLVGILIASISLVNTSMSYVVVYALMIIFLFFRPQGILGGKL